MRSTEDALRSIKRYLAVVLGSGRTPLGAVRMLRAPSGSILDAAASAHSYGVWTGLDENDDPAEALIGVAADADDLIRVPLLVRGTTKWFVTPPLMRRRASDGVLIASASSEDSFSPSLVKGCVDADRLGWQLLLGLDRYGFDLPASLDGRAYRVRPVAADPVQAATDAGLTLGPGLVELDMLPPSEDWEVRFFDDRGEGDYPLCIVKPVGPTRPNAQSQFWVELTQSLTIYCYPRPPAVEATDASSVAVRTERLRDLLVDALVGRVGGGRPMRIPLYDYDGADEMTGSSQREPYDYLRVVDASVEATTDPGDDSLQVVVADVRVNWTRGVDEHRSVKTVDEVLVQTELT